MSDDWALQAAKEAKDGFTTVSNFSLELMEHMLNGLFTPEGIKMLSIMVGVDLACKTGYNALLRVE